MSTETNVPRILSAFPIHLCKNLLFRVVGRNVNLLTIPGDRGWGVDTVGVSGTVPPAPQALLTVSGAEAPGCRDRGERGAAVHGAEVMLHVGTHVGVGGVEGGLSRASGMWGKPDQRDVGDNRAATQGRRPAETKERGQKAWPVAEGRLCGEPSRAAGAGTRHVVQILTHQPEHAGCKHSRAAAPACPPARPSGVGDGVLGTCDRICGTADSVGHAGVPSCHHSFPSACARLDKWRRHKALLNEQMHAFCMNEKQKTLVPGARCKELIFLTEWREREGLGEAPKVENLGFSWKSPVWSACHGTGLEEQSRIQEQFSMMSRN